MMAVKPAAMAVARSSASDESKRETGRSEEVEGSVGAVFLSTRWPEHDMEEVSMARGVHTSNMTCQRSALMEL
jgi:hypothetical protein